MQLSLIYFSSLFFTSLVIILFYLFRYVGKLVGRYYDSQGNPTKYLKGVEAKAARGAQLLEKQKTEEAKQPACNSRWSQDEGGEVYIDIIVLDQLFYNLCCFSQSQLGMLYMRLVVSHGYPVSFFYFWIHGYPITF